MTEKDAVEFFEYWQGSEWTDKNGVPVRNWKAKMMSRKTSLDNERAKASAPGKAGRVTGTGKGKW